MQLAAPRRQRGVKSGPGDVKEPSSPVLRREIAGLRGPAGGAEPLGTAALTRPARGCLDAGVSEETGAPGHPAAAAAPGGGRLRVFLGYAPGVGTTHRMLQAARDLASDGGDVVVGAVEAHGRYEIAGLLLGLEVLPRPALPAGGRPLEELDLDAALARRPRVVLLDRLAHANPPGSRHARRWQDAQALVEVGVEVHATLEAREVEGLARAAAALTRLPPVETVPDALLAHAEVELVDVGVDELLSRLAEGKVRLPPEPAGDGERLFRRGDLLALRELALRYLADRAGAEAQAYRQAQGVAPSDAPWPPERILVCVGPAPDSARLVHAARRIAVGLRAPWMAASVEPTARPLSQRDRERLEGHLRLAESLGAEVVRLAGVRVAEAVMPFARRRGVTRLVLGKPRHPRWRDLLRGSLVDEVIRGSGDIEVHVLSGEGGATPPAAPRRPGPRPSGGVGPYLAATALVAVTTLAAVAARALLDVPDVEMLFTLGVMVAALVTHRRAGLAAAALAVLAYDWFFVPPARTLEVADARYVLSFAMLFAVSLVVSTLALRLREQRQAASAREGRTAALYALARELGTAQGEAEVAAACVRAVAEAFDAEVALLRDGPEGLRAVASAPRALAPREEEERAARWALERGRPAGRGTDTFPDVAALCVPLQAWGEARGVLAIRAGAAGLGADQRTLLDAIVRQAAVALDRVRLAASARRAELRARTEELRSGLLSAVSHDLRTPLAAITGSATALRDGAGLDPQTRHDLADAVCEEAERLERLVSNLLDMTRLDSGTVQPRREWVPLEEVVGGALTRLERSLAGRRVAARLPEGLPLLALDPVLVEQLFVNLLENAAKYTPSGTEIEIGAAVEGGAVVVEVADRGPGVPPGQEERIFERFHRGVHAGVRGVGLGLPIARAVAQVHGGRLVAARRPGGGAVFRLTLPLGEAPPPPPAEAGGGAP